MIIIARLHSNTDTNAVWDYVLEQHNVMAERLGDDVKLLYLTRRVKYEDVSLFMHVNDIQVMGEFISQEIAKIDAIDGVSIINLIQPRFFPIPDGTRPDLPRFSVTLATRPKYSHEIYERMCAKAPSEDFVITYVAKTFRRADESIMMSMLAKDRKLVNQFKREQLETVPGLLGSDIFSIKETHRLISKDQWKRYAQLFPERSDA